MKTRTLSLLIALCGAVLSAGSAVPQSTTIARAGASPVNLGLATDAVISQLGTTAAFNVDERAQGRDLNGDGELFSAPLHVFDALTGEVRNLRLDGFPHLFMDGRIVLFAAAENDPFGDLNGDGDTSDNVFHIYDTARRSLTNLHLAQSFVDPANDTALFDGRRLVFSVDEELQGQDLNRDGDQTDLVVHLYDVVTARLQNTGLVVGGVSADTVVQDGRRLVVAVSENLGGSGKSGDLNGDGDSFDTVLQSFDTVTRRITNLGIALNVTSFRLGFKVGNDEGLVAVSEAAQGVDLNGDQDSNDAILHTVDLSSGRVRNTGVAILVVESQISPPDPRLVVGEGFGLFNRSESVLGRDLNGDGDQNDAVLHVLRTRTGQVRNLGLAARILPNISPSGRLLLSVSEQDNGRDLNGDGIQNGSTVFLADLTGIEPRLANTGRNASGPSNGDDVIQVFPSAEPSAIQIQDDFATFIVSEAAESQRDLNGDGDANDFLLHIADLATLRTRNTGLSGAFAYRAVQSPLLPASNGSVFLPVREDRQGRDLNGDGDLADMVLQVIDVRSGASRSTGFTIASVPSIVTPGAGPFSFVYEVPLLIRGQGLEAALVLENGVDLNSDGDTEDLVLQFCDLATGSITNTGLAVDTSAGERLNSGGVSFTFAGLDPGTSIFFTATFQPPPRAGKGPGLGDAFAFLVSEAAQGHVDLNGDGDTDDLVVHAARLTDRDRNGRFDFAE